MGQTSTTLPLFFFEDTSAGDLTLALPAHPNRGAAAVIKNFGSTGTLTVSGNGKLIDGSATFAIAAGDGADFFFNGTGWNVSAAKSQSDQVTLPLPVLDGGTGADLSGADDGQIIAFNIGTGVFDAVDASSLGAVVPPIGADLGGTGADLSGLESDELIGFDGAAFAGVGITAALGVFTSPVVSSSVGAAAHVAIGTGVSVDATIDLTAVLPGVVGNVYTVEIVSGAPSLDVPLGVVEAGTVTTITLGTDGAGVLDPAKNTATLVLAELGASTLFTGALAGTGDDSLTVESQIFFGGAEAITAVTGNVAGVGGIFSGNVDAATFSSAGGDPFVLPAADLGGGGALVTDGSGAISVATLAVIGTAVSLQVASPGTPDSGNFNVNGTGIAGQLVGASLAGISGLFQTSNVAGTNANPTVVVAANTDQTAPLTEWRDEDGTTPLLQVLASASGGGLRQIYIDDLAGNTDVLNIGSSGITRVQTGTGVSATGIIFGIAQDVPVATSSITIQNGNGGWFIGSSADTDPNVLFPGADNGNDLGIPVTNRVRNGYFGGAVNAGGFTVADMQAAPASAGAAGVKGDIRWTNGFVYLCSATNTWLRAALTTWI